MSKDQKPTESLTVEIVENLKIMRRIIFQIQSMIEFWHMEKVWPINLAMDGLRKCITILDTLSFSEAQR